MKRKREFTQRELLDWALKNGWELIEFHNNKMIFDTCKVDEDDEVIDCTKIQFTQQSYNTFVPKNYHNSYVPDGILDYLKL